MALAVEEILRFEPPVMVAPRQAAISFDYLGRRIRKGHVIGLCIAAANRDPRVFDDPDSFDVTREPNPHLSFGHGIHLCLGITLARLEGNTALRKLFQRFPDLALCDRRPHWSKNPLFRGLDTMRVSTGPGVS